MSLTPRSRVLAVAMIEKPFLAGTSVVSSGTEMRLFREERDHRVLHFRRAARDLLEAGQRARFHRAEDRAFDQRLGARAARDQHRVVPGVADLLLGGAGGALHDLGRVAVDGGRQVLGEPDLAVPGSPISKKRPVGDQRRDGDFDQPRMADVLGRDLDLAQPCRRRCRSAPPAATSSSRAASRTCRPRPELRSLRRT